MAYTPGHASHHVSYFDASSGVAFVGDTAGVCIDGGYVLPPTPPPDIDLEAVERPASDRILAWSPSTLLLTHFGPVTRGAAAPGDAAGQSARIAGVVRESLESDGNG